MKLKSFIFVSLLVLALIPALASAALPGGTGSGGNTGGGGTGSGGNTGGNGSSTGGGDTSGTGGGGVVINLPNPLACDDAQCLLVKIFRALWIIASLLTTLMVLVGAFQILTSAGSVEKVETGKRTITYAVIGFVVVILSWSITAILKSVFDSVTQ